MVEGTYIFDCEVFAHDWLFVFKEVATGEYTVIWNDNDEVLAFMERNPYLGGFNNKHYDNHILKAVMCGFTPEQVKEINDLIIVHELNGWDIPALREYRVYFDSFDLKDDCQDGVSLKGIEAHLGIPIEETEVDFNVDHVLSESEKAQTTYYCKYDVDATEILFKLRKGYLDNKAAVGRKRGLTDRQAMVTMSESDTAGKLDEATIKQYTGGEDITARELYQSAITFKPQFTMWLSCNDLPSVKDKSLFASDRVRVIEFNRHFTDEEQDKGLKDYFETPEAMRGIFTWLVAGYFKYIRFGLKMSQGMQKVIKQYEKDNDLVLQFLEEKCERNAEGKTRAKSLYDNYKMWCKGNGYYVCSMKKFNAELTAHPEWYADKAVTQGVLFYYGVALRQN